ncbi:subunit P of phosphatidylinositol N-acetylglucosaminyltransferase [Fusarium austroafricanum]|uniref:Subunit P of phosphatidylinositol N-acetylglucosaminyltransferase n=1 Tax=Fusarium austroafricanum TaxID=2364996 RepID=A0A8H4KV07_9HYPO|nr:subunit P of phosphatidylinositol N-acetylglucosaminyltransferase [Fusarium austroafricanum]
MNPLNAALIEVPVTKSVTHGPSAEEWEAVKEHIYKIYIIEGEPLKKVIPKMQAHHGFKATPKMYNTYFKKWSPRFSKNNRAGDDEANAPSTKFPRTRPRRLADQKCTPHRFHPTAIQPHPSTGSQLSDGLTNQQSIMKFSEVYVYSLFDTLNFSSNLFDIVVPLGTPDYLSVWQQISDECFGVITLLEEGDHIESRQTFIILCQRIKSILGSNDCGMIIFLWPICIRFQQAGLPLNNFTLLEAFLDFLQVLARERYPAGHPIPGLLKILRQTPADERFNILKMGFLRTIHCLERRIGFGNAIVLSMWSKYLKRCDYHGLPASAITSRYDSVLQEARRSFTPTGTRTIEILHGYIYAAYYNANDDMLTWTLASEMVHLAESTELMSDQPSWCMATQGYALAAKLLHSLSEQTGHGNQGTVILSSAVARLESGDRECRTRAMMLTRILNM